MMTSVIKYTAAEFATQNLVLSDGQIGLETDTRLIKIGTGTTPWISLSYVGTETYLTPRTDSDFVIATGVKLDRSGGTFYNAYTQSGTIAITIASGAISGGFCILPITLDGNTITVSGATIDPKSDTASTTATDVDRYVFWKDEVAVHYSITNLG
jgi:hypothetical protein